MAATITPHLKSETANSYVTLAEADAYFETVPRQHAVGQQDG